MSADFEQHQPAQGTPPSSRKQIWAGLCGLLLALPAVSWLWGFTVDDALITARVAAHCAQGLGPRVNTHGLVTDAVTPLGYAQFLALVAPGDTLHVFAAAKAIGAAAWLFASGGLAVLVERAGIRTRRYTPLALVAVSAPLAAWAVSGMETGLATLLATAGLFGGALGALALGGAAALRPELIPFAALLVMGRLFWTRAGPRCVASEVAAGAMPILIVAVLRDALFGRIVPLSFYAKPSDFEHGLRYALGAFAFGGLPLLLVISPREWSRLPVSARPLLIAVLGHFVALVLCGGDWMALYRLAVPVLPAGALAAAQIAEQAHPVWLGLRFSVALCLSLLLGAGLGPRARRVGADRARLIAAARPVLARDARIAALDVGWVGAASRADLIDLAGVTDPVVARFPGGHTSKRIPGAWLFARQPTAVVLLLAKDAALETPYWRSDFSRSSEGRVAALLGSEFRVRTLLPLAEQRYVVLEPAPLAE